MRGEDAAESEEGQDPEADERIFKDELDQSLQEETAGIGKA